MDAAAPQGRVSAPAALLVQRGSLAEPWRLGWGWGRGCGDLPAGGESKLTRLCQHPGRAGVVGRKLSFIATGPFLKLVVCQGDLRDQMRQEHLYQQAGQPCEEGLNKDQCGK